MRLEDLDVRRNRMLGDAPEGVDTTTAANAEAQDRLDDKLGPIAACPDPDRGGGADRGRRRRVVRADVAHVAAGPSALRV